MLKTLLKKVFDDKEKELRIFREIVRQINDLEDSVKSLSEDQLKEATDRLKSEVADGKTLDQVMPEAFALVREAGRRYLKMRHFDVQLMGGMALHQGRIAEMRTGEGKTLVATLPLYLNALEGKGAHLVTVNDYLARRDAVWMGPLFAKLGLSVGVIQGQSVDSDELGGSYVLELGYEHPDPRYAHLRPCSRKEAYACDITYGTNHEFAFDYLRDNMSMALDQMVQRDPFYAIVDEVDSILIDEARTPHIISGAVQEDVSVYYRVNDVVKRLQEGTDYTLEEKHRSALPTEKGMDKLEQMLGITSLAHDPDMMHYVSAGLKAHALYKKDVHYVVKDGEIVIVDEFTGRMMFGRRFGDGLHQAIEAKEGVRIKQESQTIAVVTFQNYFRMYPKLAGMTGTAKTEEEEFRRIYGLDVFEIPTNRPMIRTDHPDVVFRTLDMKFRGIAMEILRLYGRQQPVLVGTRSIEMSEVVSQRLTYDRLQLVALIEHIRHATKESGKADKKRQEEIRQMLNQPFNKLTMRDLAPVARELEIDPAPNATSRVDWLLKKFELGEECRERLQEALEHGVPHSVLNAKFHEKEAIIIASAGRKGAVTIATNMAGRGVDILLGGRVQAAGANEQNGEEEIEFRRGGKMRALPPLPLSDQERSEAAEEVRKLGGLMILGTERHESRRIDNQLRGRAGRQGDPGESRFFLSLEDEFIRLFGDKVSGNPLLRAWPEEEPLAAKILSKAVEGAQKRVELHNFAIRKHVLQYDDVLNNQRQVVYRQRRRILEGHDLRDTIVQYLDEVLEERVDEYLPPGVPPTEWDLDGLWNSLKMVFPIDEFGTLDEIRNPRRELVLDQIREWSEKAYQAKEEEFGIDDMREVERHYMLRLIDQKWIEHLASMEFLREGIGLRGYGQVDPLVAYKRESAQVFSDTLQSIRDEIVFIMFRIQRREPPKPRIIRIDGPENNPASRGQGAGMMKRLPEGEGQEAVAVAASNKPGRNDPCPCGSGKKYKKCCYPKYG
ncbi:MAG: preprotein translocase subunit SecA [Armatimonadetes bacterium]|nr:preprotein translocase subunit SecA [Armatimonadota bacterium]